MAQFLIRLYLEDMNPERQARLNKEATDFGLVPFIRWEQTGQRYALPPDTYIFEGDTTADALRESLADVITSHNNWQTVVVAQTVDLQSHGLMPLDPPPEA